MGELTGRCAIVTGGSRGIGRAIALEFAKEGASIVVWCAHHPDAAQAVAEEIRALGADAFVVLADVHDADAVAAAVAKVIERFGHIDILVNNAGITRDRTLAKMSSQEWADVIDTDLNSVFHVTSAVLPHMVQTGFGRIVNISSVIGVHGNFGQANYAAAKAGIIGFTKAAALELAKKGVTVNVVAPGFIETEMIAAMPEEVRARIRDKVPMGRFGRPEEIARAVRFLVTEGDYMTGQVMTLDGGLYT